MTPRYDTVTFLSDYGHADEFVGVVHSVIRSTAPHATIIDLTHEIAPFDVRAAGLLLARSAGHLCPGVVVAVVDPGVGTERRAVAVEIGGGESVLVGPDNGVLAPVVALCGGADRAVELDDPAYHLPTAGSTFDGRDVFAPVAGHLCNGVPLEELGTLVDPAGLLPGIMPVSRFEDGVLDAEVLWVDRYGNAQLNIGPDDLTGWAEPGEPLEVSWSEGTPGAGFLAPERDGGLERAGSRIAVWAETFAGVGAGRLGLVLDSYGLVALTVDRGSAADELGLVAGTSVRLRPVDEEGRPAAVTTPVGLGPTRTPEDPREEPTP